MRSELYRVKITSSALGVTVQGWLPEEFTFGVDSEWEPIYGQDQSTLSRFASGLGVSTRSTSASTQIWTGNSPISLTIPIDFIATSRMRLTEVVSPVKESYANGDSRRAKARS